MYFLFLLKKHYLKQLIFPKNIYNERLYKSDIKKYINKKFPNQKYKFKFMEKGIIPMFHLDHSNDNLISIGTRGNWVRVSTGYSFQNSFANAKKVTDKLLKKKKKLLTRMHQLNS